MTLDDRLRTVLQVAVDSDRAAHAQYRQLVDLLGSGKAIADGSLIASAFLRLTALGRRIPIETRVAMLREPAMRLRSAPLVAHLCEGERAVAEAALGAASIDAEGWKKLLCALDEDLQLIARAARLQDRHRNLPGGDGLLAQKRRPLPDPASAVPGSSEQREAAPLAPAENEVVSDIAALVERIETFRARRDGRPKDQNGEHDVVVAPEPVELNPDGDARPEPVLVDCTLSADGRISWAAQFAPMLTGLSLSSAEEATARLDEKTATLLRRQQVVRSGHVFVTASPTVSGEWRLDAAPRFDAIGRFLGHYARLTREVGPARESDPRGESVRQALHELRTPLNALQGFAEIIQQQLFGPVPHQYRGLAAGIAAQSAALLAGLEDVERLARLRNASTVTEPGETALSPLVSTLVTQFAPTLAARGAGFTVRGLDPDAIVPLAEADAERLVWRLLAVLGAASGENERLPLHVAALGKTIHLSIALPLALAGKPEEQLFDAEAHADADPALSVSMLGGGFALRLVKAEARAAGGSLRRDGGRLVLTLPQADAGVNGKEESAA